MKREIKESLDRYAQHGMPTGSFLRAVLSDELTNAVCYADADNLRDLKEIVIYVLDELPTHCHGSDATVRLWIECKAAKRQVLEVAAI